MTIRAGDRVVLVFYFDSYFGPGSKITRFYYQHLRKTLGVDPYLVEKIDFVFGDNHAFFQGGMRVFVILGRCYDFCAI